MRHGWPEGRKARGGSLIRGRRFIMVLVLLAGGATTFLLIPAQGEIQESGPPAGTPALRAGREAGAEHRAPETARGNDGAGPPATLPCRYEIMAIIQGPFCPGWGNAPVFARGLSNHDPPWVTGFYTQCTIGPEKAFVWTGSGPGGGLQTLQFPGVDYSFGLGLNDHGKVVGQYLPNVGGSRGFIYDVAAGTYITLEPIVPNGGAGVWDINNAGIAVGSRTISQTAYNAFIWKNGVYTDLGVMNGPYSAARAISENGIVVGWTGTAIHTNNARAFVHQAGQTTILPMPPNGVACAGWAVNSSGDIVGGWKPQVPSGPPLSRGALWRNGLMIDLGLLPLQPSAAARGISDDGHVIIGASGEIGCVWRHENIANLNALIPTGTGVWITDAYAMNKRGEILCEASHASGRVAVVLTPVLAPPGDATLDCIVNVNDLLAVINAWGQTGGPADLNQDGIVNHLDLLIVINNWSSAP